MNALEGPSRPLPRGAELWAGLSRHNLTNGFMACLFASSGPLAVYLASLSSAGFGPLAIASILFGAYAVGGVASIGCSLFFRQPLALAWTIPGAVILGPALQHLTLNQSVGSFYVCGVAVALLGLTGLVGKVMRALPTPIVMAMVAAVFLPFVVRIIPGIAEAPILALPMIASFLGVAALPRLARQVPPVLLALLVGMLATLLFVPWQPPATADGLLVEPRLLRPEFSPQALLELVLPMMLTVVGIQNAQGFFVLRQAGYRPPANSLTFVCGVGTWFMAPLGAVPLCVTGPANAILNSSGPIELRFMGGVVFGVLMLLFGLFAPVTVGLALALPPVFIGVLGGLAMLAVLQNAFVQAFSGRFALGALISFTVTFSGITLFHIGAPFWGLVFGYLASRLLEPADFRHLTSG